MDTIEQMIGDVDAMLGMLDGMVGDQHGAGNTIDFVLSNVPYRLDKLRAGGYDAGLISAGQSLVDQANGMAGSQQDDAVLQKLRSDVNDWVNHADTVLAMPPPSQSAPPSGSASGPSQTGNDLRDQATNWVRQVRQALTASPPAIATTPPPVASVPPPNSSNVPSQGGYGGGGGSSGGDGGGSSGDAGDAGGAGDDGGDSGDGGAADDGSGGGEMAADPTQDPNSVMFDASGGSADDSGYDTYGDDDGSDGSTDVGGGGHGGGHGGHHGHGGGFRYGAPWYGGPWYDYGEGFDLLDVREPFDEVSIDDVVSEVAARLKAKQKGKTVVGGYDLGTAQKQMDVLKQVTVGVAQILLRCGQIAIGKALMNAKQPWYKFDLPGDTARKNVQGHLQWHADKLSAMKDIKATYDPGADLKKWVLEAYVEQNASEEGAADSTLANAWSDYAEMWVEIGKYVATLPGKVADAIMSIPGKLVEGITGIPLWGWIVGGVTIVVLLGFGVYKLASKHGGIVVHAASRRYLP